MRDIAAPLYRFFLADAQAAARAGESGRALECLGLALDFVPESQRERVLLAAAELAPAVPPGAGTAADKPMRRSGPSPALVVEVASGHTATRSPRRIAWEHRPPAPASPVDYQIPVDFPASTRATVAGSSATPRRLAFLAGVLAVMAVAASRLGWTPAAGVLGADPATRAARALQSGDAGRALRVLEPLGGEVPAPVWLLRGSAYEALADTPAAVTAWTAAAASDVDGGKLALEAGDRLERLGALSQAADAYLYAVTADRTDGELERIARVQERAGHVDRARRIRR